MSIETDLNKDVFKQRSNMFNSTTKGSNPFPRPPMADYSRKLAPIQRSMSASEKKKDETRNNHTKNTMYSSMPKIGNDLSKA
jgi:hypothetical protein